MKKFITILILIFSVYAYAQEEEDCLQLENKKAIKLYNEAYELFNKIQLSEATNLFKQVIEIEDETPGPYFYLGYINFYKENYKVAETYFLKSIEKCAYFDIYAYYYLGDIYAGREDWKLARKYLSEFVSSPTEISSDRDLDRATELLYWAEVYDNLYNNPVEFNPEYIKNVCTPSNEYLPNISPDGEMIIYTRVIEVPPQKGDLFPKTTYEERLFSSESDGKNFKEGVQMPYPFDVTNNIGGISITIDNKELYVAVCRYINDYLNCDICHSIKDEWGYWSDLYPVPNINGKDTWDVMPSISSDGKTLYFVSDRPGGFGGYDIWCSHKKNDTLWTVPENLGPAINSEGNEKTPFIHPDMLTLYFSSADREDIAAGKLIYGHPGVGGYDIFYSRKKDNGSWGSPKNIGYPINTASDETGFLVSTDGKTGFYTTNYLSGPGGYDIFTFDLYKNARPEKVLLLKGDVKDEETQKAVNATIELKNVETKKITEISIDSTTGNYVAAIVMRNDYVMTVKKEDYAYESKYISAEDSVYTEISNVNIDFEIQEIEIGKSYTLNDIYFETNSYELNNEAKSILDGFIEFLNENTSIKISIEGHTDDIGNDEDNLALSENRAKSVYEYLITNNISENRLSYKGFGESKPVESNNTPEGRAKNRRTIFVIIDK